MKKLIYVFFVILLSINNFSAQTNKSEENKEKVRIDQTKPIVYIDFVKLGEEKPLYVNDSKQRVYLKLVNNSKWSIYVNAFVYGDKEEKRGLYYEVERERLNTRNTFDDTEIPTGYRQGDTRSGATEIKSGDSINFSVPRNHLAENLKIRSDFDFEWSRTWMSGFYTKPYPLPEMSVVFLSSNLEKILKDKEKNK